VPVGEDLRVTARPLVRAQAASAPAPRGVD